jgi:hypothetical protein
MILYQDYSVPGKLVKEEGQRPRGNPGETRASFCCIIIAEPSLAPQDGNRSKRVGSGEWGADILERRFVRVC